MKKELSQADYLWVAVSCIAENKGWNGDGFDISQIDSLNDHENIYLLLQKYIEDHEQSSARALVKYVLVSYYYPVDKHLWLLAACLDTGFISEAEAMDLLPTIGFHQKDMPKSYQKLYQAILTTAHDDPILDATDASIVSTALRTIRFEKPR